MSRVVPRIQRFIGRGLWVCSSRGVAGYGVGATPREAYLDWVDGFIIDMRRPERTAGRRAGGT